MFQSTPATIMLQTTPLRNIKDLPRSMDLNEALEREPYHTYSVDKITAKLKGMTVFIIVDFRKGYWMVVLHPESRKLTCMALPFGRFQ